MAETKDPVVTEAAFTETVAAVPTAASYADIKAECSGADAEFICGQLEVGATVDVARKSWMATQQKRIEAAGKKAVKPAGVAPVTSGSQEAATDTIDAVAEWNTEIDKLVASGMTHRKAASKLNRRNPDLREAMVVQFNEQRQRSR